jgi:hypothetical protein
VPLRLYLVVPLDDHHGDPRRKRLHESD